MKLNLSQLRDLEAIGRCASVTAAARELYRSPSTLSYSIKKLEESLGVALLDRSGHNARLTPAGEALAAEARALIAHAQRAERRMHLAMGGWEPALSIAVSDLIPMGRVLTLLGRFYRETPDTRVRLMSETLSGGWDALVSARADLAIGAPLDGAPAGALEIRPLAEVRFVFVIAKDHPLAAEATPLSADVVRRHRAIAVSDSSRSLPTRSLRIFEDQPTLSVPDQETKHEVIRRGLGAGFLPERAVADDIKRGLLLAPPLDFSVNETHKLCYAWRADEAGKGLTWITTRLEAEMKTGEWIL